MGRLLEAVVRLMARLHVYILTLNDESGRFTDKQLHFLVIAALGMGLFFIIWPLFKKLGEKHIMTIAFIYVLTLIVVITFAIEIGQMFSGTGVMEFADIVFGITGFILAYVLFLVILQILNAIKNFFLKLFKKK